MTPAVRLAALAAVVRVAIEDAVGGAPWSLALSRAVDAAVELDEAAHALAPSAPTHGRPVANRRPEVLLLERLAAVRLDAEDRDVAPGPAGDRLRAALAAAHESATEIATPRGETLVSIEGVGTWSIH